MEIQYVGSSMNRFVDLSAYYHNFRRGKNIIAGENIMVTTKRIAVFVISLISMFLAGTVYAGPTTTIWTPATPDIQGFAVPHFGIVNYFTVFRDANNGASAFPTDIGLTIGVLPFDKLQMEIGVDLVEPNTCGPDGEDYPWYFNAKIGSPEDTLFKGSPAIFIGIFNVGTKKDVTNENIAYLSIGKTIPYLGRLSVGPYIGNKNILVDKDGDKDNVGFMVAIDHGFLPKKDKDGNEYNRVVLAADYASGENVMGALAIGVNYFFTKDISLLTGPVFFNDVEINGKWKWTTQFGINLDKIFGDKK